MTIPPLSSSEDESALIRQSSGEASADAEVFAGLEAARQKLINALYSEIIHQQPEAVFRGQYGVLEIGDVKINCCALAHEALRALKEAL